MTSPNATGLLTSADTSNAAQKQLAQGVVETASTAGLANNAGAGLETTGNTSFQGGNLSNSQAANSNPPRQTIQGTQGQDATTLGTNGTVGNATSAGTTPTTAAKASNNGNAAGGGGGGGGCGGGGGAAGGAAAAAPKATTVATGTQTAGAAGAVTATPAAVPGATAAPGGEAT